MDKFLGGERKYMAGNSLTWVDFSYYDFLSQVLIIFEKALDNFSNLKAFHQRMDSMKKIQEFKNDPRCILRPLNNTHASFK